MKKLKILAVLLIPAIALASSIKVWTSAETIRASDLNANFSHLHNNLGHGHGAVITNADIAADAGISHSKFASPALVAKGWASMNTLCDGAVASGTACPATVTLSGRVTAIQTSGTAGQYLVQFSPSFSSTSAYAAFVTAGSSILCHITVKTSASQLTVQCRDWAGVLANSLFDIVVFGS